MSWRVMVERQGERVGNALRFETAAEAECYGFDLLMRWTWPESYEVEETPSEPATYRVLLYPTRVEAIA